ncbi:hypothetical protein CBOM_05047 [Ceraceosorus bombacis]|uniref:Uncharacterized protein n=1 Tax=Ceraceosorus bombacis TaxID=401625 RepID=A0A0P1BI89_9BASI|nr:hypothetical protein CBOM_05047 [Ceraceosorus bombacis]
MDLPLDPPLRLRIVEERSESLDDASEMLNTFIENFERRTAAAGAGDAAAAASSGGGSGLGVDDLFKEHHPHCY